MLITPLGEIELSIDGIPVFYVPKECKCDRTCVDLDGRYRIDITYAPDGEKHTIACGIKNYIPSWEDEIESGERLELKSFHKGKVKLSIGAEGDAGYDSNDIRIASFDYDNEYLDNGLQYVILPETKTTHYVFAVAWLSKASQDNEVQTWYGADPAGCMECNI